MSSQSTKEILTNLDRSEFLSASTRTQMPLVSPKLAALYGAGSTGDGETPRAIDFDHVQESNATLLDATAQEVRDKAHVYRVEKAKLSQIRKGRGDQAEVLRQLQRDLGTSIDSVYGPEARALVGLDVPPARPYTAVREQTVDIANRIRRPDLIARFGPPRPGHSALDFDALAEILNGAVQGFEQLSTDITRQQKVRDEALIARNEAAVNQRRVLANVARVQEGYYRLAGLDELADRIRVTIPKRTSKKTDDTPGKPDDPPSPAPADEPPAATPPRNPTS